MDTLLNEPPAGLRIPGPGAWSPHALGSAAFRADYGVKYAYVAGAMYKGIASKELVVAMGRAGMLGYLGTGGLDLTVVEAAIEYIRSHLDPAQTFGMNLLSDPGRSDHEMRTVELYLRHGVRCVEAAAYMQVTPALVRYRLSGLRRRADGTPVAAQRVMGKVSRPEVAEAFMRPAPAAMVQKLVHEGLLTAEEGELAAHVPVASDICVEADSGGHTDQGVAYALVPAMLMLRDQLMREHRFATPIRVGAAGGIGTPQAAAASFVLGADFILTGSINQCTVEAGTSDAVKDMLQGMNVQDTDYAPAGDMFELGARVQVLKKGLLFPARANKLYQLYQQFEGLEQIDEKTRTQIQERYFRRSFDDVWAETRAYLARAHPATLAAVEASPKRKMAAIFKWYFIHSTRLAMSGDTVQKVDYQVQCGPALGSFNQWVKGTELESWRNRRVADLGERLMQGTAHWLAERLSAAAPAAAS